MNKEKLSLNAKTFLATDEQTIQEVAQRVGIQLPSNNVALFQSIYANANEEANLNGVRLTAEAVEKALPTLIGAQANLNHSADAAPYGAGFLVGIILAAWVDANKDINIIFSFAKNVYQEDYQRAIDLMQAGKLSVSFELLAERDTQERKKDGTVLLHDVEFTGVGLLLDSSPAYPKAKVYEMAQTYKNRANSEKELVFASQIMDVCDKTIEELNKTEKVESVENPILEEGGKVMKKLKCSTCDEEVEVTEETEAVTCAKCEEMKKAEVIEEAPKAEEVIIEAPKTEEEAKVITTIDNQNSTLIVEDETSTQITTVSITTETRNWEEEATTALSKVAELETVLTQKEEELKTVKAELDVFKAEKEAIAKAEAEAKIAAEQAEKDAKLAAIKDELKDNPYTKEFKDEDYLDTAKVENAKILKERDDLKAEVETLRAKDKEVQKEEFTAKKSDDLDTGHQELTVKANPRDTLRKLGKK